MSQRLAIYATMVHMSRNRLFSVAVAAMATTAESFTTLRTERARLSSSFPHRFVTSSDAIPINLDHAMKPPSIPNISPCGPSSCSVETLDAEMDTFADPNDKRYAASDWLHNMKNFHNSSILRDIKNPVSWITAWSTLVSIVHRSFCVMGHGDLASRMCLGSTPHSLISSSIGLLLVFRTNSAYQKFRVSISKEIEGEHSFDMCC